MLFGAVRVDRGDMTANGEKTSRFVRVPTFVRFVYGMICFGFGALFAGVLVAYRTCWKFSV
jgi:hypothetical protein